MVDKSSQVFGVEEVDAVKVGDVDSTSVGSLAVRAILLYMEAKEADLSAIDLFKHKHGFCPVRKLLWKISLQRREIEQLVTSTSSQVEHVLMCTRESPHLYLKTVPHQWPSVQDLVEGGHGSNDDL